MSQLSSVLSVSVPSPWADDPGLLPPGWVGDLLGPFAWRSAVPLPPGEGLSLEIVQGDGFCLASVRVPGARGLDRTAFQDVTTRAYGCIEAELRSRGVLNPVRLWNHIPGIHDPMGDGQDRYMIFNAGRYEALAGWFGQESFDTRIASASGIGHGGEDLVLHCLASDRPGHAVANPRQTAPYRYSHRYGPLPPCFARATVIQPPAGAPLLLVGGTASIVGEESVHLGDVARQTDETLTNLAALLLAAAGQPWVPCGDRAAVLACFRSVRVYYPEPERWNELHELLEEAFPEAGPIEWVRADLCRAELLVEIEGVAQVE